MYGYVIPDKPNMFMKDYFEFRAYYCGLCKTIGKRFGQLARFTLSYDMTFLSAFIHSAVGEGREIVTSRCVCHPFHKREVVKEDRITEAVASVGMTLAYYKLRDDVVDGKRSARIPCAFINRKRKKARGELSSADYIVSRGYENLRALEKMNVGDVERVADCFATMLEQLVNDILGVLATEFTDKFAYCLGKWIYLVDALDDYDDDVKKENYNPFRACYGAESKAKLLELHGAEIRELIFQTLSAVKENYDKIPLGVSEGVVTNTVYHGLPFMTNRVLRSEKCKRIRL